MSRRYCIHAISLLSCLALQPLVSHADVRLPRVFSDHMVVQRDRPIPIWGWGTVGEVVSVTLGDSAAASATVDKGGNWRVDLAAMPAGGPFKLTVTGKNTLTIQDAMVGEVWFCAGQSNMEWPLDRSQHAGRDIPQAADPQLRLCKVDPIVAARPQSEGVASWAESTPGSAAKFSAVAYYFGKELREKLGVPVGVIVCSAGGTSIETWMSAESCRRVPSLAKIDRLVEQVNADYRKLSEKNLELWIEAARQAIANDSPAPPYKPVDPIIIQRGWLPTGIYNGGINPLLPYGIRGVVWYQGEANNGDGMAYLEKLETLIQSWRQVWGLGDFPFLIVQIAPWAGYPEGNLEGIWEAQFAATRVPNTGMVVTTDLVPNIRDIHPTPKLEVGHRLAVWAMANTYGTKELTGSGPLMKSIAKSGGKFTIQFDHVGSGLNTRDGKAPDYFQIGTPDRFEAAEATIQGDVVVVESANLPMAEFVRFGWRNIAQPNLTNKEGLPTSPFRTDCSGVKFNSGTRFARHKHVVLTSDAQGTIRYTLDGSTPTLQSTAYTVPFDIDQPMTVSARLFQESGASSMVTRTTYTQVNSVTENGKMLGPGLDYEFFVGKWNGLPDFDTLQVEQSGVVDSLTLAASPVPTQYALRFRGYLDIPRSGEYTFVLKSDDGAKLFIDGMLVINDDGQHAAVPRASERMTLSAGKHPFSLDYQESWGGSHLSLSYEGPEIPLQEVPATAYFRAE